jgi:cytochrome c oxidase subunit 3/cytochrome o ubiquinol oxidase subunit 3
MTAHAAAYDDHGISRESGVGIYTQKLGMWVFLASEVMFFTALIGSYIILRWGSAEAWARPGDVLNIPLTALNTFILICSSVSMVKAYAAAVHDDQKGLRLWLCLTVLMGAFFVSVQAYEYWKLSHEGFLPMGFREGSHFYEQAAAGHIRGAVSGTVGPEAGNLFGTTFYIMTGFHGFHVTCGVISMAYVTLQAFRGKYVGGNFHGIETIGLYWHFVDLVWILLFTIVYLI